MAPTPNEASGGYLGGVEWPASKDAVLAALHANGAPDDLVETLRTTGQSRIVSPASVAQLWWNAA